MSQIFGFKIAKDKEYTSVHAFLCMFYDYFEAIEDKVLGAKFWIFGSSNHSTYILTRYFFHDFLLIIHLKIQHPIGKF